MAHFLEKLGLGQGLGLFRKSRIKNPAKDFCSEDLNVRPVSGVCV
jgi:hypothetical protein